MCIVVSVVRPWIFSLRPFQAHRFSFIYVFSGRVQVSPARRGKFSGSSQRESLLRTQWVCLGHNVESNGIAADFSPRFSGKKGGEIVSLSFLARDGRDRWFGSLFDLANSFIRGECCFEPAAFRWIPWNAARSCSIRLFFGLDPRVSRRVLTRRVSLRPTAG